MDDGTAYVDGERLREFALDLRAFAGITDKSVDRLATALAGLGRSWEDQAFGEFQQSVRGLAATLLTFVDQTESFSAYLLNKAEQAKNIHVPPP